MGKNRGQILETLTKKIVVSMENAFLVAPPPKQKHPPEPLKPSKHLSIQSDMYFWLKNRHILDFPLIWSYPPHDPPFKTTVSEKIKVRILTRSFSKSCSLTLI